MGRFLLVLVDAVTALVVPFLVSYIRFGNGWEEAWQGMLPSAWLFLGFYVAAWVVLLWAQGLYRWRSRWSIRSEAQGVAQATVEMAIVSFVVLYLIHQPEVSRLLLFALFPLQGVAIMAARVGARRLFRAASRRPRSLRPTLIVGTGSEGRAFARQLTEHPELGLHVVGFLGEAPAPSSAPLLGGLDDIQQVIHHHPVEEVAVCLPYEAWDRFEAIVDFCTTEGKLLRVPLQVPELWRSSGHLEDLDGSPVLSLGAQPDRALGLALKRVLDICGSGIGLIVLSPLLGLTALAIALRDGRPVLFRQTRVGLHGREFQIVKFRTMGRDADAQRAALRAEANEVNGAAFKMTHDPRITPLGRLLRRTSIDELPQLWNVLRGDMSLVGPRPHPLDDVAGYDLWHRRRLSMKPGITGLWQVRARGEPDFDRWVQRDLEYIDGWSLWLDVRLLLSTIPAVLRSEGR
jgi:exopolysaccharide biosynthesis polyprenyl glycosylphosphotransferase